MKLLTKPTIRPSAAAGRRLLIYTDAPASGGTTRVAVLQAAELGRRGYGVTFVCPSPEALGPWAGTLRSAGVSVLYRAIGTRLGIRSLREMIEFAGFLRRQRLDLAHFHLPGAHGCRFAIVAARLAGVAGVVATEHLPCDLGFIQTQRRARWLRRLTTRWTDVTIGVSRDVAGKLVALQGLDPARVVAISNGIEVGGPALGPAERAALRRELGVPAGALVIGNVALLNPQKGHSHLLRAAARVLREARQDVWLVIAGDGPLRGELEGLAADLGIAGRVRFLGFRPDIPRVLALFDIFALSSLYEGLPLVVAEAMAAGRPVVATAVGGTPEMVADGQTGLLVPPGDAEALATALLRLVEDPAEAAAMGRRGQERARRELSVERMVDEVEALYGRVLGFGRQVARRTGERR